MITQLFVAAGGRGKRLGKYTAKSPKSLIEVAGRPIIDHIITVAMDVKIDQIVVGVDAGKRELVRHLPPHVIVRKRCVEPLSTCFFRSARDLHPDIICGCNGDTLFCPDSLKQIIDSLSSDQEAAGAVLLTNVVKPLTTSRWTYWRYRLEEGVLVEMEAVPGHEIRTDYVISAFRTEALRKLTEGFTKSYRNWRDMPFACYSWGWDYILRLLVWKNFRVIGIVTDHPYLNVNYPHDIEEGQYFFKNPELFRKLRTIPQD